MANEISQPETKTAAMIARAAARIGATVAWQKLRYKSDPIAVVSFEGGEVAVEDCGDKLGALVEPEYPDRKWWYTDEKKLAESIRRRVRAVKAADARQEKEREERRRRDLAEAEARRDLKEALRAALGEDFDAYSTVESHSLGGNVRAWVNVTAGRYSAERLTLDEAVKYFFTMRETLEDELERQK